MCNNLFANKSIDNDIKSTKIEIPIILFWLD